MITLEVLCRDIPGLSRETVLQFVAEGWVRAERAEGELRFDAMDAARVRLIAELRGTLEVEEATLPVVLSLLDQLYATRRQLRRVLAAAEPVLRERLLELLREP